MLVQRQFKPYASRLHRVDEQAGALRFRQQAGGGICQRAGTLASYESLGWGIQLNVAAACQARTNSWSNGQVEGRETG